MNVVIDMKKKRFTEKVSDFLNKYIIFNREILMKLLMKLLAADLICLGLYL